MTREFNYACKSGNLDKLKLVFMLTPAFDYEQPFREACRKGYLHVIHWLIDINPKVYVYTKNKWAFRDACVEGHFDIILWFIEQNPDIKMIGEAFKYACYHGKIDIAKSLYATHKHKDFPIDSDALFYFTCYYTYIGIEGCLDIAKWLLETIPNINISANNNYAFRFAYYHKCWDALHWLQSLKPHYFEIIYGSSGNVIKYNIREKEEAIWQKRKYIAWLASDNSPNKKSLIYLVPPDVSRHIITFI